MSDALLDRFLRYVRIDTQSNEKSSSAPSTPGQTELLRLLQRELVALGAADVQLTSSGFTWATLPATKGCETAPVVALLAHVDTAPDFSGANVKPRVHRRYQGKPIRFPDDPGLTLDPAEHPELLAAKGKDIVTASGKSLLGADDKAGVAILMTLAERFLSHPELPHGPLRLCFTRDEEIGRGVDGLDLKELGAQVAYTLDGQAAGEICWETFSADAATVTITGVSTHPGDAKAKGMVNAAFLAAKFVSALPRERCAPETTAAGEGYIHPTRIEGGVDRATVNLILRDFELRGLTEKRALLERLCQAFQAAEPRARIECQFREQYRNMAYWLRDDPRPVERARQAVRAAGLTPVDHRARGGTDGSRLTERGLPTPDIFCGAHNAHGPLEWVAVQDMELAVEVCVHLAHIWSTEGPRAGRRRRKSG